MPEISVIVPVYNCEMYIQRCIDSILAQTYRDFEVILIDDGSSDRSGVLCEEIAEKQLAQEKEISFSVLHQKNAGQSAARNRGIEVASGRWVTFIDSDDYVHPQLLEILYEGIKRTEARISMCGAVFRATPQPASYKKYTYQEAKALKVNENFFLNLYRNDWLKCTYKNEVIWGKLIDISIVKKYPLTEGRIYEDSAIMCQWFEEAGIVEDNDIPLYYYVDNPGGTMNANFSGKKLDKFWSLEEMERLFKNKGYSQMVEVTWKLYLDVTLVYEKACVNDPELLRHIKKLRKKKALHAVFNCKGTIKQKFVMFRDYYMV